MSEPTTEMKEWAVAWEMEVELTIQATVKVSRVEIVEGATEQEAIENAQREADVDETDIDLDQLDRGEFDLDFDPDTFKVESIEEWKLT